MASPEGDPDLPTTEEPTVTTEPAMEINPNVTGATTIAGDILETAPKTVVVPGITGLEHEEEQAVGPEVLQEPASFGEYHGARPRRMTEKGLQYQIGLNEKMLRTAITVWRRKANAAEVVITDSESLDDIKNIRNDMAARMTRVEEIYDTLLEMDPSHPANIELIAEEHHGIIRRSGERIRELKLEIGTNRSRRSSYGSTRSSRALQLEAAAKAAEIKAEMTFQEKEKQLLEEKIRLKQEKQMAEEKEMRIEQRQKAGYA